MPKYSRRRLQSKASLGSALSGALGKHYNANKRAYHQAGADLLNASASVIQRAYKRNRNNLTASTIVNRAGSSKMSDISSIRTRPSLGGAVRVSEWGKKVVIARNIGSAMSSRDRMLRMSYPPAVDRTETFSTVEFDSPKQGIKFIDFITRDELKNCFNLAMSAGAHVNNGTYQAPNVTRDATGSALGNASNYNIDGLVGSYRAQDVDFWINNIWQQHQIQNSCSNSLEFTIQTWHPRMEFNTYTQDIATTFDNYHPHNFQGFVEIIGGFGSVNPQSAGMLADSGNNAAQRQDPYRHGTNLASLLGVKQYYKLLSTTKFVLKPGEQKDVMLKSVGKHRLNLPRWRNFMYYKPVQMYVTITCRASLVGHSTTTQIAHGSGAYMHAVRTGLNCQFGGWRCPKIVRELTTLDAGIDAALQENINPETDAKQGYVET